ncbi:MAG TPA: enoyl-CoA hydratase/isomerase family protein [Xanthobacteraceae bacterium]|jgi:enoyl-CoA hydratase|nr:enoyl-CoA hydratase/isomerase family protein [Xanthobacteraceae bacterium]
MTSEPEILFDRRGAAGIVILNRPQALNAVTHDMVRALRARLDDWRDDRAVTRVVVIANGGRAFSAGGDLRRLYDLGRAGRYEEALDFWRDEYALNATIKRYPKPYIALIDGIVMGGGVGISIHGSHRVAGDKFQFAMPEVGIGFFPDVGATWFLPRLPGEIGTFCALTAERLTAADAVAAGVATHRIDSGRFDDLLAGLCGTVSVDALLAAFAAPGGAAREAGAGGADPSGAGPVTKMRGAIDRHFAGDTVEDILAALETGGAAAQAATIRSKAPLSLKLALAQLRRGRQWDFDACMRAEFRIVSRIVRDKDFYEGVRAVIVDKDNAPRWRPATLSEVATAEVERHFAPLERELALP